MPHPAHRWRADEPSELYQRLAADETACYLVEESLHGARTFMCNARMADMFISTEELQGLVRQTGLAVGHLMMRCVVVGGNKATWRIYRGLDPHIHVSKNPIEPTTAWWTPRKTCSV